jgi:hypothetical protein
LARKYTGRGTEAMQAIAKAHQERSLAKFEEALKTYKPGNHLISFDVDGYIISDLFVFVYQNYPMIRSFETIYHHSMILY